MRRLVCPLSYIVIVLSSVSISFVISFSVVPVRRAQSQATTRWHNNNRQSHPARRPFLSTPTSTQLFGEVNQKLVEQLIGQIAERQLLKESKEEDLVAIDREIEELYSQVERQVQELKAQKKNQQKELDSIRNDIAKRLQKLELAERGEIGSSSSSASQLLDLKRLGIDSEVATTVVATVSGLGVVAVAGRAALIQRKEDEERRERLRLEEEKQKELQRIKLEEEKAKAAETKKTTQLLSGVAGIGVASFIGFSTITSMGSGDSATTTRPPSFEETALPIVISKESSTPKLDVSSVKIPTSNADIVVDKDVGAAVIKNHKTATRSDDELEIIIPPSDQESRKNDGAALFSPDLPPVALDTPKIEPESDNHDSLSPTTVMQDAKIDNILPNLPKVDMPSFPKMDIVPSLPKLDLPEFSLPKLDLPELSLPKLDTSSLLSSSEDESTSDDNQMISLTKMDLKGLNLPSIPIDFENLQLGEGSPVPIIAATGLVGVTGAIVVRDIAASHAAKKKEAEDKAEALRKQQKEELAAAKQKALDEAAAKQKQAAEEEAAAKRVAEEEAARKKKEQQDAAKGKAAAEEEARLKKLEEEEIAKEKVAAEEARLKQLEEERLAKEREEEKAQLEQERVAKEKAAAEEAKLKQLEEERIAQKKAELEEWIAKGNADEEARMEEERIDREKAAAEEANKQEEEAKATARREVEEEAARKKAAEEAEKIANKQLSASIARDRFQRSLLATRLERESSIRSSSQGKEAKTAQKLTAEQEQLLKDEFQRRADAAKDNESDIPPKQNKGFGKPVQKRKKKKN